MPTLKPRGLGEGESGELGPRGWHGIRRGEVGWGDRAAVARRDAARRVDRVAHIGTRLVPAQRPEHAVATHTVRHEGWVARDQVGAAKQLQSRWTGGLAGRWSDAVARLDRAI